MADRVERNNEAMMAAMHKLRASQATDKNAQAEMLSQMCTSAEFYVPVMMVGEGRDRKPAFGIVMDKNKQAFYMLFTDREKVEAFAKDKKPECAIMTFEQIADRTIGDVRINGFVVNPGVDDMIIGRQMIMDLRARIKGEEIGLQAQAAGSGEDASYYDIRRDAPTAELLRALDGYMRKDENIAMAYIRMMRRNGQESYCLVVRHVGPIDETFEKISNIAAPHLHGKSLAILSARSSIAEKVIGDTKPFYRKPFTIEEDGE